MTSSSDLLSPRAMAAMRRDFANTHQTTARTTIAQRVCTTGASLRKDLETDYMNNPTGNLDESVGKNAALALYVNRRQSCCLLIASRMYIARQRVKTFYSSK
jgi:hypothetical protein